MTLEIISLVFNFILSSGIVGMLVFYNSKKRKAAAEATSSEAEANTSSFATMQMQVKHFASELKSAYVEMRGMQDILDSNRTKIVELTKECSRLEIALIEAENAQRRAELNNETNTKK